MKNNASIFKNLCITAFVFLLISVFAEIVPKDLFQSKFINLSGHRQYVVSLSLGIFTGAIIGLVTTYIQYANAKFENTSKLILKLIEIISEIQTYNFLSIDNMEKAKKLIQIRDTNLTEIGTIIANMVFIFDYMGRKQRTLYDIFYKKIHDLQENISENSSFIERFVSGQINDSLPGIKSDIESCEKYFIKTTPVSVTDGKSKITNYNSEYFFSEQIFSDVEEYLYPLGYGKSITKKLNSKKNEDKVGTEQP